ncbi:MAG: hypothetical protein Hyperionvirus14_51 [Hyperionvirus sp.]|uniref:Uncharacterized protein n=1 Tax=Hyperionvirus sp. TaxID=2487770 RepID=A0A3G5AA60_9VIRU|nr:MAG: hypothetical protein Hyperionvirus14_51 [Hyperionvirus sp.]
MSSKTLFLIYILWDCEDSTLYFEQIYYMFRTLYGKCLDPHTEISSKKSSMIKI